MKINFMKSCDSIYLLIPIYFGKEIYSGITQYPHCYRIQIHVRLTKADIIKTFIQRQKEMLRFIPHVFHKSVKVIDI